MRNQSWQTTQNSLPLVRFFTLGKLNCEVRRQETAHFYFAFIRFTDNLLHARRWSKHRNSNSKQFQGLLSWGPHGPGRAGRHMCRCTPGVRASRGRMNPGHEPKANGQGFQAIHQGSPLETPGQGLRGRGNEPGAPPGETEHSGLETVSVGQVGLVSFWKKQN